MGTNAAFGRPPARERVRDWWYAKSRTTRSNILITLAVGSIVVALVRAATSGDADRSGSRVNATRPTFTVVTPTSTTLVGSLFAAADPSTPADPFGLSSTTSSTTAVAPRVTAAPSARSATPSTSPPPATTVPTPDVIYTEVPAPVTTVPVSRPPVATTAPPTTATPTTPPPTTVPRAATRPTTTALLGLPLIGSG